MYPIYERAMRSGIGLELESFIVRFEEICRQHVAQNRASAFAFIFYDFDSSEAIQSILGTFETFTELDRLAGRDLSIFYLNTGKKKAIKKFNSEFLDRLQLENTVNIPCVVFFKYAENGIYDIEIAQLDRLTLERGFHYLYVTIERYIEEGRNFDKTKSKSLKWLKSGIRFMSLETFKIILKEMLEHFIK
jgi:hypothetical protein